MITINKNTPLRCLLTIYIFYISGCNYYPIHPEPTITDEHIEDIAKTPADDEFDDENSYVSRSARFRNALRDASANLSQQAIDHYVDVGITVADLYCDKFFSTITQKQADQKFARKQLNLVGGLADLVLGATNTSAGIIASTGIGFTFLDDSFQNLEVSYLISPDIPAVQNLVDRAQLEAESNLRGPNKPTTYAQSERMLNEYVQLCNFTGIKRLVSEAVDNGEVITTYASTQQSRFLEQVVQDKVISLAKEFDVPSISQEHLTFLYWYFIDGPNDKELNHIKSVLKHFPKPLFEVSEDNSGNSILTPTALLIGVDEAEVRSILLQITNKINLATLVDTMKIELERAENALKLATDEYIETKNSFIKSITDPLIVITNPKLAQSINASALEISKIEDGDIPLPLTGTNKTNMENAIKTLKFYSKNNLKEISDLSGNINKSFRTVSTYIKNPKNTLLDEITTYKAYVDALKGFMAKDASKLSDNIDTKEKLSELKIALEKAGIAEENYPDPDEESLNEDYSITVENINLPQPIGTERGFNIRVR
jgi:hypothetical protein